MINDRHLMMNMIMLIRDFTIQDATFQMFTSPLIQKYFLETGIQLIIKSKKLKYAFYP